MKGRGRGDESYLYKGKRSKMKSMTGYGTSVLFSEDLEIHVGVRAVNGRSLDVHFHTPKEYFFFEPELRRLVGQYMRRGVLDVHIQRRELKVSGEMFRFVNSPQLAQGWLQACEELSQELGVEKGNITVYDLVQAVDVIHHHRENNGLVESEKDIVLRELKKALEDCNREREKEGQALKNRLLEYVGELKSFIKWVEDLRQKANERRKKVSQKRLKNWSLDFGSPVDPQRLAQEMAIQLEKVDVDEELVRLIAHMENFEEILAQEEVFGRKLEFYTQEFLREVNTIGSKSHLAEMTHLVVNAKVVIDRIKEQAQNVE